MRLSSFLAGLALLSGCTQVENPMIIAGNIAPTTGGMGCIFEAASTTFRDTLVFDPSTMQTLKMVLKVQNNLRSEGVAIGSTDQFPSTNGIRPVAMSLRWECNTTNEAVEDIKLPSLPRNVPFCSPREGTVNLGSDDVIATGARIEPQGSQPWVVLTIVSELGARFRDAFYLADQIDQCCNTGSAHISCLGDDPSTVSSDFDAKVGERNAAGEPTHPCGRVNDIIQASGAGKVTGDELRAYSRWLQFSAGYSGFHGAGLPMRVAGVLKGITDDGDEVESNDWGMQVQICNGNGSPTACKEADTCFGP